MKYTKKILCSNSKINFGYFSLKIKQLRYLLFSSQQLPAWVYSYIILEDEPVDVRYSRFYPTSLQHEKLIITLNVRPTFKLTAFLPSSRLLSQAFRRQTSDSTSIRFDFDNLFISLAFVIFNFVNWLFLNSNEFELGSMY